MKKLNDNQKLYLKNIAPVTMIGAAIFIGIVFTSIGMWALPLGFLIGGVFSCWFSSKQ